MAPMAIATPRPATVASAALRGSILSAALFATSRQSSVIPIWPRQKNKGGRSLCRPHLAISGESLLQIGHRRQVGRELDDTGRAAPVRPKAAGVDRGYVGRAKAGGAVIA